MCYWPLKCFCKHGRALSTQHFALSPLAVLVLGIIVIVRWIVSMSARDVLGTPLQFFFFFFLGSHFNLWGLFKMKLSREDYMSSLKLPPRQYGVLNIQI